MKEEERKRVYEEVMKQEKELSAAQAEHNAVRTKLAALERKIIVGGILLSKLHPMKYFFYWDRGYTQPNVSYDTLLF